MNNNILNNFDKIINTNLNINSINYKFNENGRVSIDNIFESEFAERLYNHLINLDEKKWFTSCVYNNTKYMKQNIEKNKLKNRDAIIKANTTFGNNDFSYVLNRTMNSNYEMNYIQFILRKLLSSTFFINLINKCLGMELKKLNDLFISYYKPNNFLSPHCDVNNGTIAVTISLTKDWLPQYGGNLTFLTIDRKNIIETIVSKFNTMYIFYIPPTTGIPHFVSHVAPNVKKKRFTITLWYE